MNEEMERSLGGGGRLSRRHMLQGLALAGLAVAPVVGRSAFTGPPGREATALDLAAQRLRSLFADPDELAALGRAYLAETPLRPDLRELLRQLMPPDTSSQRIVEMEPDQLRDAVGTMIEQDLRDGRIMAIDGWLLSETELRLTALALLTTA